MGAVKKYNYDDDEFYDEILMLAMRGYTNSEIGDMLDIAGDTFNHMLIGKYAGWTEQENIERSARMNKMLERGRKRIVGSLRGMYIRMALGKHSVKSVSKKYVEDRCECGGSDEFCPICGGLGKVTRTDKWITMETEADLAPNMQALGVLLYHYDPEWRAIERNTDDKPKVPKSETGISIEKWINAELLDSDFDKVIKNKGDDND